MVTLTMLGGDCSGGECPTVYQGSDGAIYIQGFKVPIEVKDGRCGSAEDLVRITPALVDVIRSLT